MTEDVQPVLVRVPRPLCERLTAEARQAGKSRHALMLDKLAAEPPPRDAAPTAP